MANNLESNITKKLAKGFMTAFESGRVLSKNINTQLLSNAFNPGTGDTVYFKRPTDFKSVETLTGDLTGSTESDIIVGQASGKAQPYISVHAKYSEFEESLELDDLSAILAPAATRIVTTLELNCTKFMMNNSGLLAGSPGNVVTTWDHLAEAGAVMAASGVPRDDTWFCAVNPHTQTKLASDQRSLGAGGVAAGDIDRANKMAVINENFAGMKVMTSSTLASFETPATGDLVGTVNGAPAATYVAAKDTMTQAITIAGIGAFSGVIPAGTIVQVAGRNRLNLSTRRPIIDGIGANRLFTAVVTADATIAGGAGTLIVSGPGIYEANGAYNTIDSAIADGDVITILNADSTLFQPNLFWHKQAFSIGSIPIKKLYATDTVATTADGLQLRVCKYSDGKTNTQMVRFDLHPAFAVLNPFFAGHAYG